MGIGYTVSSMTQTDPISPQELIQLVLKAQDGDTEAFGKIYDAFLTPVYRYVVFRFPSELTEDLVADIFVKAFEKLHSYRPIFGVPFSAWLFRIARHTLIDAYRKNRGFEELSEELIDESRDNDPKLKTEQALSVKRVREAIMKLPEDYRDVVLLHYISGLGHAEVAKALRMTEGYVRILKFRALKKLEGLLGIPHTSHD